MNQETAMRRLQSTADSLIEIWSMKLKCKIAPVKVQWENLFNVAGEYSCRAHTITLNKQTLEILGFYQMERVLRHELAHAICYKVYNNTEHDAQFADINRQVGGVDRDE